jgi:hypothetical protein
MSNNKRKLIHKKNKQQSNQYQKQPLILAEYNNKKRFKTGKDEK